MDKEAAYRKLGETNLESRGDPPHRLDHPRGAVELRRVEIVSRSVSEIQHADLGPITGCRPRSYDVQLLGDLSASRADPRSSAVYHGICAAARRVQFMRLMPEAAPNSARRFSRAATIFANLHSCTTIRRILRVRSGFRTRTPSELRSVKILPIYLHRAHAPAIGTRLSRGPGRPQGGCRDGDGAEAPSVHEVLAGTPGQRPARNPPKAPHAG